jgi:hypothetical protein
MKSFRSAAAFGAATLVILTSGAAFAGTPSAPSSGATARPAASARAHSHRQASHARHHRAVTPAKKK